MLYRVPKIKQEILALLYPETVERPKTRADCAGVARPCPYVGCRHNLYLDAKGNQSLRFNFPDLEPWEMPSDRSCVLDIVEQQGPLTLEETGAALNMTRERARQIQVAAWPGVVAKVNAR